MKSAYTYCSRCGGELRDDVRRHYEDNHTSGPVLCATCVQEVLQGISRAIQGIMDAFADAANAMFKTDTSEDTDR